MTNRFGASDAWLMFTIAMATTGHWIAAGVAFIVFLIYNVAALAARKPAGAMPDVPHG